MGKKRETKCVFIRDKDMDIRVIERLLEGLYYLTLEEKEEQNQIKNIVASNKNQ